MSVLSGYHSGDSGDSMKSLPFKNLEFHQDLGEGWGKTKFSEFSLKFDLLEMRQFFFI